MIADNDHEMPVQTCPTCGRALDGFTLKGSQLLDMVLLAQDVLSDLQAAIEEEVLP
jgi:hypothetical protein